MRSGCTGAIAGSHISQAVFFHNENELLRQARRQPHRSDFNMLNRGPLNYFYEVTANYQSFRRIQLQSKVNLVLNNSNNTAELKSKAFKNAQLLYFRKKNTFSF